MIIRLICSRKPIFLVNPSNPASHALSDKTLQRLKQVVEKNPNLIILTDDVYGTFAEDFRTVYSVLPYNTILVYSFSKLYGVTGWRVGLIAMNRNNVCDRLLSELPEKDRDFLHEEYAIVTSNPEEMSFLDRVVADSRSIGLYHTSGLSTPSQAFMALMSLTHLVNAESDPYIILANETVKARYAALMNALGLPADESAQNTMYGPGFDAPEGTVRISLANLNEEDYVEIARRLFELLDDYYSEYKTSAMDEAA